MAYGYCGDIVPCFEFLVLGLFEDHSVLEEKSDILRENLE